MPIARADSPTVPMPQVRPRPGTVRMPNACAVVAPLTSGRTLVPGPAVVVSAPNPPLEIAEP